jgi:hypothetical protein
METCPICRATLNGASACRRCRADLQQVQEIERRGQTLAGAAMRALAEQDLDTAEQWLRRARAIHVTPAVQALERSVAARQQPRHDIEG